MGALAMQGDTDTIPCGQHRADVGSDGPGWVGQHVLRERDVRLRNPIAKTILHHRLRAARHLFRGLEHCDEGSAPRSPGPGKQLRRAQQAGHVSVVTAGMHDGDTGPSIIGRRQCRCVRQARALLDGKRVHVGAREHGLARAVSEDADDAGTADLLEDFVAELFELRRRERGGPGLVEAELGVCVEILVDAFLPERCRRETVQDVSDARQ